MAACLVRLGARPRAPNKKQLVKVCVVFSRREAALFVRAWSLSGSSRVSGFSALQPQTEKCTDLCVTPDCK